MNFVTGGTGLVGAYLLMELSRRKKNVRALRRSTSAMDVTKNVFKKYLGDQWEKFYNKIEWIEGDILDMPSLEEALNGADYVYHSAGYVSYQPRDKQKLFDINQQGTENMVNASLNASVRKFLYVSSIAALDKPSNKGVHKEEQVWKNSESSSNYGQSKYLGELEVWRGLEEGLNMVIINPSIILGYGDYRKGSTKLFTKVHDGLKFYTGGVSGFVDVRDVVNIMIELMNSEINGERFIVNSEDVSFKRIFDLIAAQFGKPAPKWKATPLMGEIYWRLEWIKSKLSGQQAIVTRETSRAGQRLNYYANDKIKQALGYEFIPVEQTIKEIASILEEELT